MGLTTHVYTMDDLVLQDKVCAPSLDIPSLEVEGFYLPRDNGPYMLFLTNVKKSICPQECPFCREAKSLVFSGFTKVRVVPDVTRNSYRVDIAFRPPRLKCKKCGAKYVPSIPGISELHQMTERLEKHLRKECFPKPFTELAISHGISVDTIRDIMDEEIEKFEAFRANTPLQAPRVLGIDEKHFGRIARGTLVDIENGILLDIMENNKKETMKAAIMRLKGWETNIEVVTCDMSSAYTSWVPKFLPNALVVIDKYHVIQDVERRINETKKDLLEFRKNLINKNKGDSENFIKDLKAFNFITQSPRLFNFSMETITRDEAGQKAEKLATAIDRFPEYKLLRKLYYLIELMYTMTTYEEAKSVWDEWVNTLPPADDKEYQEWCDLYSVVPPLFEPFRNFSKKGFQKFREYILNYFKPGCRHTNATTEGYNRVIKDICAEGNGYSFKVLRAKALYTRLVKDRVKYTFDTSTINKWSPTTSMSMITGYSSLETITTYTFSFSKVPNRKPIGILLNPDAFSRMLTSPKKRNEDRVEVDVASIVNSCEVAFSNKVYK